MSIEHDNSNSSLSCVICTGDMHLKEVRRHPDPAFDVYFLKCRDCGLERPIVREREGRRD